MCNVRNVLNIGVFEAEAMQVSSRSAEARTRWTAAFEDVFGVGFGVDEQRWAFGNVAVRAR